MAKGSMRRRRLGVLVTVMAIGAIVVHTIVPSLKSDTLTLVLVVVALLPWLGNLLESVELPGGWKVQYRGLEERVENTEKATARAGTQAAEAASTAQVAIGVAGTKLPDTTRATMDDIRNLSKEFARLRALPHQLSRTQEMDRLFGALAAVAPTVPDFDPTTALDDEEAGLRLAGYAYLYSRPDSNHIAELAHALLQEQSSFNQYWAIRSLRVLIAQTGLDTLPVTIYDQLRKLKDELPADSARHAQLSALLGD
jgi:hypothetical protein